MYLKDSNQTSPRRPLADLQKQVDEVCAAANEQFARKPRRDASRRDTKPSVESSLAAVRRHVDRMAEVVAIYKRGGRA